MKKNLRIVSAAAAALLAVAPVAAAAVATPATTVNAAAPTDAESWLVNRNGRLAFRNSKENNRTMNVSLSSQFNDFNAQEQATINTRLGKYLKADYDKARVTETSGLQGGVYHQTIKLPIDVNDSDLDSIVASGAGSDGFYGSSNVTNAVNTLPGLTNASVHIAKDGKIYTGTTTPYKRLTVTITRWVNNTDEQGTPYFYYIDGDNKGQIINDGSTVQLGNELSNGFSAQRLLNIVKKHIGARVSDTHKFADDIAISTTSSDVAQQLDAQGLKKNREGNYEYPANGFNLKLTAKWDNGQTTSITVRINSTINYNAPVFAVKNISSLVNNGEVVTLAGDGAYNIKLNGTFDKDAFSKDITAFAQNVRKLTDASGLINGIENTLPSSDITVDSSAVNTKAAGYYPVVVTAKNPAGLTSKITVMVKVGDPDATYMYTNADADEVVIDGNQITPYVVNNATQQIKKGQQVATYGAVTINGVSYTRLNSKDSKVFVKTSDLTATKPATTPTTTVANAVSKKIMHVAAFYDKDGKRLSDPVVHAYNSISVLPDTVTISGKKFYQVVENGKAVNKYVKASNIDATPRTLKHNSYVYKSNGKTYMKSKKHHEVVKSGSTVNTYGGQLKVNGSMMYRIDKNRYIKAANFR